MLKEKPKIFPSEMKLLSLESNVLLKNEKIIQLVCLYFSLIFTKITHDAWL